MDGASIALGRGKLNRSALHKRYKTRNSPESVKLAKISATCNRWKNVALSFSIIVLVLKIFWGWVTAAL
jgi:hypothetical protein